jgi:hypothetical protein
MKIGFLQEPQYFFKKTLPNNNVQQRVHLTTRAQPGMQATRSANAALGGNPSSFPFPSVGGVPTARA